MQDRGVLRHRIGAGRGVERHRHDRGRALLDQQIAARQLIGEAGRRSGRQEGDRAGAVGAERVPQRARGVGRIDIVAGAARIAARQRVIVEQNRRIRAHRRRVVVDVDDERAVGGVAVAVGDPIGEREVLVVLVQARRVQDRGVLRHRIGAGRGVERHRHDRGRALLDQQIAARQLIGEAGRRSGRQEGDRAGAVGAERVPQRARGVGRIDIVAGAARIAARQRVIVEQNRRIRAHRRRVVVDVDDERAVGGVAVLSVTR